ncbi:hypothetical protein RYX36_030738 [Vicia faba]
MSDPILAAQPPEQLSSDLDFDDIAGQFNNIPIPSLEDFFNGAALDSEALTSDLEFPFGDFEITFDDIDNLPVTDGFLLPEGWNPNTNGIPISPMRGDCINGDGNCSPENFNSPGSGASVVSGDQSPGVSRFLNSESIYAADNSVDSVDVDVKVSSIPLPETENSDREESTNGPVSSHGSGNGGSGVYEAMNSPSDDFGSYERDISSSHEHAAVEEGVKVEGVVKGSDLKRKKDNSHESAENRTPKCSRRSSSMENKIQPQQQSQSGFDGIEDDDEKRKARLIRNRESAQLSRQRKKHYVEELEEKVRSMHSTIADLSSKITYVMAENATLRQQLSGGVMCPPPPPGSGMYPHPPMAHMPYPWMPCAPYVVRPQGSQVPLVPIPRLKPQQPAVSSKSKKNESKKTETKKTEVKTKKVASISLLGLFFCIMLFGGLVPLVDFKFGGLVDNLSGRSSYVSDRWLYGQGGSRVWTVNDHMKESGRDADVGLSNGRFSVSDRNNYERGRKLGEDMNELKNSSCFGHRDNASEPLLASLYVPRNDKLVKIDGNLIIHSIMASEKAMASQDSQRNKEKSKTGLAIPRDSALAIPEVGRNRGQHPNVYRVSAEQRRAIGSGSAKTLKDHMKSSATDGKMQQWFREGVAGPMLSSGMCTEVFQFDVSPAPGAIVPATTVTKISTESRHNATTINMSRNRRILHGLPDPLPGSKLNITEEHARNLPKDHLPGNKSSMVVSVLVDPKEVGDGDVDGMMAPKSLSRIFVVVLLDSVKYVTYSCGLPRASSLVAAYV